jgi:hypothetical protein
MVSDERVAYIRGKGIAFQLIRCRHLPADPLPTAGWTSGLLTLGEEGISIQTCPQMEISECVRRGKIKKRNVNISA